MANSPSCLLFEKIIQTVLFGVAVVAHGIFIYIMQQIKIKVLNPAALQLFFEYLGRHQLFHPRDILMPGKLVRQEPAFSRIPGQRGSDCCF